MKQEEHRKKILVAPLNWGLGHATRCIPIIGGLLSRNFQPILAGDGMSLDLLRKEFPDLKSYVLPGIEIHYPSQGNLFRLRLLSQTPKLLSNISKERKRVEEIHEIEGLCGIISDNRFGVRSDDVPSVFITHQLNVLSGSTTFFSTLWHQRIISKFNECWVPDFEEKGLAGRLSHLNTPNDRVKYIGPQSRLSALGKEKKWDLLFLLSGPEPQRSIFEEKIIRELQGHGGNNLIVRGIVEEKQTRRQKEDYALVNFMQHKEIQDAIDQSHLIISRSGYSTLMDLHAMEARAFFVPTPGQYEQEYLAKIAMERGEAKFCQQESFEMRLLNDLSGFEGFRHKKTSENKLKNSLFDVFN